MTGRICATGAVVALLIVMSPVPASAQVFTVTSAAETGTGSLTWAINSANASPGSTINFNLPANSTILLTGALPQITANMTINGSGASGLSINGNTINQVFFVSSGTVAIKNMSVINGLAQGGSGGSGWSGGGGALGAGGGLFVSNGANVTLQGVNFNGNQAIGGNGGASFFSGSGLLGGGGGGGMNGNGQPGYGPLGGNGGGPNGGIGTISNGGNGGNGGGGAGGGETFRASTPGSGGFGGGGGGASVYTETFSSARGGFGAGSGGNFDGTDGGGGSGYGGAIFVQQGGTISILNASTSGNSVTAGSGSPNGQAAGADLYLMTGVNAVFNGSQASNFTGDIAGAGGVTLQGTGNVTLSGANTYSGATTINNGQLTFNGLGVSAVTVGANGTLAGSGTIYSTVDVSGKLGAAGSISTLTMGGLTTESGSTVAVQTNAAGNTPGVNNTTNVVQGNVTLNGGTVDVLFNPGTYHTGTTYTFLSYTGTLSGAFSGIETDVPFLTAELIYGSGAVEFELLTAQTHFGSTARTYNEAQLGTYLDAHSLSATGNMANLIDQVAMMSNAGQRTALQTMNGQVNGTLAQLGVQNTTLLYQLLRQNMGTGSALGQNTFGNGAAFASVAPEAVGKDGGILPVNFNTDISSSDVIAPTNSQETGCVPYGCSHGPCWTGWTTGYGTAGTAQGDGNASGGSLNAAGAIVGVERALDEQTLFGVLGAYSHLGVGLSGVPQSASADEGQFGVYLRHDYGDVFFDAGGDYSLVAMSVGFTGYDETRQITVGSTNSTASGDSTGWEPSVYLEQGHRFDFTSWSLRPYAALQYVYLRQNAYTESGAGVLDQSVDGSNTDSLRSFLGTSVASRYVTQSGSVLVPEVRAAWVHEYLDTDTTQTAAFASLGSGAFAAQGLDFGRDWALVGGGVQWLFSPSWSVFGNYDLQVNTRQSLNTGSGGIQFAW